VSPPRLRNEHTGFNGTLQEVGGDALSLELLSQTSEGANRRASPCNVDQPFASNGSYRLTVEPREQPLHRPLIDSEGGTIIVRTTQSGKGVTLSVLASQAVYRGDVVIVIDPKNSKRLKGAIVRACADAVRAEAFLEFHPAFPERGIRFDPLFNWQKPTELASGIQSVMPPDTTGSFSAFGWDAVNVVVAPRRPPRATAPAQRYLPAAVRFARSMSRYFQEKPNCDGQ